MKVINYSCHCSDYIKWSKAASLQKWPFYQCCYTVQWSSWLWKFYYHINIRQQYFWIWFLSYNTWLMWWLLIFLMAMQYCVLEKIYWCMHELYTRVQVTICSFTIKFIVFNCWHFNAWFVHPQITFGTCDPQYFIGIVSVIFFPTNCTKFNISSAYFFTGCLVFIRRWFAPSGCRLAFLFSRIKT